MSRASFAKRASTPASLSGTRFATEESVRRNRESLRNTPQQLSQTTVTFFRMTPDVSTMLSIKQKIDQMMSSVSNVIKDNDVTPEIQTILRPVADAVHRTYPPFHQAGTRHFSKLDEMRESATSNQVLSSASVRLQREAFAAEWNSFCQVVDELTETQPPPHAKEIQAKFQTIRSALDGIKQVNDSRRYPCLHLTKSIDSIHILCKSLSDDIIELFSQPSFPHFKVDLYASYKRDVRSFLHVINNAFANEFLQSGVMLCDLARIKANIFTDCNEVILSLRSAFAFPVQMEEIQNLKDRANEELKGIMEKLSVQFAIVKPSEDVQPAVAPEVKKPRAVVKPKTGSQEEDPDSTNTVYDYMTASRKVRLFVKKAAEIMETEIPEESPWTALEAISERLVELKELSVNQEKQIKELTVEALQLQEADRDREAIYNQRQLALTDVAAMNNAKVQEVQTQLEVINQKNERMNKELLDKTEQIRELTARGDPIVLRRGLAEIGNSLLSYMQLEKSSFEMSDEQIIERVKELSYQCFGRGCANCEKHETHIRSITEKLRSLSNCSDDSPDYLIARIETHIGELEKNNLLLKDDSEATRNELHEALQELNLDASSVSDQKTMTGMLRSKIRSILSASETQKSSFNKKEDNYIRTLNQISGKLSRLLEEDELDHDEVVKANPDEVRSMLIERLSSQLKRLRSVHINLLNAKQEELNELQKQYNSTISELAREFGIDSTSGQLDKAIRQHRVDYEEQISHLNNQVETGKSALSTIDTRIRGICRQQRPTKQDNQMLESIFRNLDSLQDQLDLLNIENRNLSHSRLLYRNMLLSIDTEFEDKEVTDDDPSDEILITRFQRNFDITS